MPTKKIATPAAHASKRARASAKSAAAAPGATRTRRTATKRAPAPRESAERKSDGAGTITPEERHAMVARAAYLRAERRGFAAGHELEDWAAAEAEVDAQLAGKPTGT